MKIAVISSDALPSRAPGKYGGLEVIAWTLAEGFAKLGHKAILFAKEGSDKLPHGELVEIGSMMEMKDHMEMLNEQDVIVDHSWHKVLWSLRQQNKKLKGFCVHHGHHMQLMDRIMDRPNLVGLTRFHAGLLQAEMNVPVRYLYNGISLEHYPLYEGKRNNRLLYLNRLHPEKGAHYHIMLAKSVGLPLDLIGTEDPRLCPTDFIEAILKRSNGKNIRLWGDPGQDMKVELLQRAKTLLWITPDFNEPFGMGIIEAMACGTPVIALNRGGIAELIDGGGVVIEHWDEFPRALEMIPFKRPPACRENAELFSVERMCQGYLKLIEEVADGGGW